EEVGEQVTYVKPGDHVIACLSVFCGHCEQCLTGHPNRCFSPETRRAPDDPPRLSQNAQPVNQFINISSFAEKMLLHENAVVKIREDVPLEAAALIGTIPIGEKVEIDARMLLSERKLQGSIMGSNRFRVDMPRYIDFYLQGRLKLDEMITRKGHLEDVNEAFRAMKAGEVARTVLTFN